MLNLIRSLFLSFPTSWFLSNEEFSRWPLELQPSQIGSFMEFRRIRWSPPFRSTWVLLIFTNQLKTVTNIFFFVISPDRSWCEEVFRLLWWLPHSPAYIVRSLQNRHWLWWNHQWSRLRAQWETRVERDPPIHQSWSHFQYDFLNSDWLLR